MEYSTHSEIEALKLKLGDNPMFVCDMDGNIMSGYMLPDGKTPNPDLYEGGKIPDNQTIPPIYSAEELDYYLDSGQVLKGIFASKTMDVRLPSPLVKLINHFNKTDQPFRLTLLTSRNMQEAQQILKVSGVKNPEKVTLVADSGATLQIKGELKNARPLDEEEQKVKDAIEQMVRSTSFRQVIADITDKYIENADPPYIEIKGIAVNVHYRKVVDSLEKAGRGRDTAALNQELTDHIHQKLAPLVEGTSFELRTGSLTVETIIKDINKGHGLEAIVQAAIDLNYSPSAVIFSGDDVCNRKGGSFGTGTDYYAMAVADDLEKKFQIPFFNTHTHHPEQEKPIDRHLTPNPNSDPANLPADYAEPRIDLRLPFPWDNAKLISDILYKNPQKLSLAQTCNP